MVQNYHFVKRTSYITSEVWSLMQALKVVVIAAAHLRSSNEFDHVSHIFFSILFKYELRDPTLPKSVDFLLE